MGNVGFESHQGMPQLAPAASRDQFSEKADKAERARGKKIP